MKLCKCLKPCVDYINNRFFNKNEIVIQSQHTNPLIRLEVEMPENAFLHNFGI